MRPEELGWTLSFQAALSALDEPGLSPERVVEEHRGRFRTLGPEGEATAIVAGRFVHEAIRASDFPVVGDWVAVDRPAGGDLSRICWVLPRRTALLRRAPDQSPANEQVLAANLDIIFLATSLTREFNPRRLERYLALIWASGAQPVVTRRAIAS
jgi:ribosome biogenesis GTPase